MLIIARRKGQRIVIGHGVEVLVTEVTRGTVKLGISAPAQCPILRGEVHDAILTANREAAKTELESDNGAHAAQTVTALALASRSQR